MAVLGTFTQQPSDVLDYDFDFSEFLPPVDTLASVVATAAVGITLGLPVIDGTRKVAKQWVSGGTVGVTYKIELTATSVGGRVKQIEFKVKIREY